MEPLREFGCEIVEPHLAQQGQSPPQAVPSAPVPPSAQPPAAVNPPLGAGGIAELPVNSFGYAAIRTKSGLTMCMIDAQYVACETNSRSWPEVGVKIMADGTATWVNGNLGDIRPVTLDYRTYRVLGWTVEASVKGTRFTNVRTGHGAMVSTERVELF